jgi:hypothetical protein
MWTYQAPVADMLHLFPRVLEAPASWAGQSAFGELDADTVGEVLQQAGRFASEVTTPTSAAGDVHGCTWSRDAADRVQMRAPQCPTGVPTVPGPDPIAWHPAVCRTLLALRARIDAAHPVACWCATLLDEADHHPDAERRAAAADHVARLTPVAKPLFAGLGHRSADEALQIWGGYGYMHDYGSEQTVCDSRTAMIYEGTNEIQAIDLVQRKLLDDRGARAEALIGELAREVASCRKLPALQPFADALDEQMAQWGPSAAFGLPWLLPQPQVHRGRALRRDADLPFLAA